MTSRRRGNRRNDRGRAAAARQVMQAAPGTRGLTDFLRFRFRGCVGGNVRRPAQARQAKANNRRKKRTKKARSLEHSVIFTPGICLPLVHAPGQTAVTPLNITQLRDSTGLS